MNRRATVAAVALLIGLVVAACGKSEPERQDFKLNPGEFYCHGYKETSPGDALLQPGDYYWHGATSLDCPII